MLTSEKKNPVDIKRHECFNFHMFMKCCTICDTSGAFYSECFVKCGSVGENKLQNQLKFNIQHLSTEIKRKISLLRQNHSMQLKL